MLIHHDVSTCTSEEYVVALNYAAIKSTLNGKRERETNEFLKSTLKIYYKKGKEKSKNQ